MVSFICEFVLIFDLQRNQQKFLFFPQLEYLLVQEHTLK